MRSLTNAAPYIETPAGPFGRCSLSKLDEHTAAVQRDPDLQRVASLFQRLPPKSTDDSVYNETRAHAPFTPGSIPARADGRSSGNKRNSGAVYRLARTVTPRLMRSTIRAAGGAFQCWETTLDDQTRARQFEAVCMPHLNAAYNLAHWLARDERNAEDIVQEACMRAYKFIQSYDGDNGRAWLLAIVRNTFYTWLDKNKIEKSSIEFDEETLASHGYDMQALERDDHYSVERALEQQESRRWIDRALQRLPAEFREVIVLRELEELSYKEISTVTGSPVGTVMSRLSRARKLLLQHLKATEEA